MTPEPAPPAPASVPPAPARAASLRERLRGPWRVTVAEGSMLPAIGPGDWLLVDPTIRRWPRAGSIVLFREPETEELAIKRVAARSGDRVAFAGGFLILALDEAWLESDATAEVAAAAGFGAPIDSNRFGPVGVDLLVGRAWFRYGPLGRIGRLPRRQRADTPGQDRGNPGSV